MSEYVAIIAVVWENCLFHI